MLTGQESRFINAKKFLQTIAPEWLNSEKSKELTKKWKPLLPDLLNDLKSPQIVFDDDWNQFLSKFKPLWEEYWGYYSKLHNALFNKIQTSLTKIKGHAAFLTLKINPEEEFSEIFSCSKNLETQTDTDVSIPLCTDCQTPFSILKLNDVKLDEVLEQIQSELEPVGPTDEQKTSWETYRGLHSQIESTLKNLESLKQDHSKDPQTLKIVQKALKDIQTDKNLVKSHKCSENPISWTIQDQKCTNCKKTYEELLDINAKVKEKYQDLLIKLKPKISLPFHTEVDVNPQKTGSLEKIEELIQQLQKILQIFRENPPEKSIKLSVNVEES